MLHFAFSRAHESASVFLRSVKQDSNKPVTVNGSVLNVTDDVLHSEVFIFSVNVNQLDESSPFLIDFLYSQSKRFLELLQLSSERQLYSQNMESHPSFVDPSFQKDPSYLLHAHPHYQHQYLERSHQQAHPQAFEQASQQSLSYQPSETSQFDHTQLHASTAYHPDENDDGDDDEDEFLDCHSGCGCSDDEFDQDEFHDAEEMPHSSLGSHDQRFAEQGHEHLDHAVGHGDAEDGSSLQDDSADSQQGDELIEPLDEEQLLLEQRLEEGRRIFQMLAAKTFEQRVVSAFRERMSLEKQQVGWTHSFCSRSLHFLLIS